VITRWCNLRSVDGTNHTTLAVTLDSAIVPDGILGLHVDGEDFIADLGLDILVTTEEGSTVDRLTGLGKAALGDGVETFIEVELDSIANLGGGLSRSEVQTVLSDLDDVDGSGDGAGGKGQKLDGRGVHFGGGGGGGISGDRWMDVVELFCLKGCLLCL
jgi:hypothetical protein